MKKRIILIIFTLAYVSGCSNIEWLNYSDGNISINIPVKENGYLYYPNEEAIISELNYQNKLVDQITDKYGVKLKGKINIYLYPKEIAFENIGTVNGGGYDILVNKILYVLSEPCISVISEEKSLLGDHETVHAIFIKSMGYSKSRLITEGLAVAIDKGYGTYKKNGTRYRVSIYEIVRDQVIQKQILSIKNLCSGNGKEELFYPQAGIFIEWLIRIYGFEKYKEIYNNTDKKILDETQKYFGISIEELEHNYRIYLLNL